MLNRLKLIIRSIRYGLGLFYRSSGLMIVLLLLLQIAGSSFSFLQSFSLKGVLDGLSVQAGRTRYDGVILWAAAYIALIVLTRAQSSATSLVHGNIVKRAYHEYKSRLAERLAKLPLSVTDSSVGRDMIDDVSHSGYTVVYMIFQLVGTITALYSFAVAFGTLLGFSPLLSVIMLALTLPGVILNEYFEWSSDKLCMELAPDSRKFSYYRWMLTDAWPAKDVRMYNLTDDITKRYHEEKTAYIDANKRLDKRATKSIMLADLLRHSGEAVLIVFAVYKAVKGQITVGDVTLYTSFAITVGNSFENMLSSATGIAITCAERMGRVFEFYDIKIAETTAPTRKLDEFRSVSFENVCFKYPYTDKYILSGVSFTINRGDKISLVGINGSGKSTIIKLLLGLYEIDSGRILINGYPMQDYDIGEVRKLFSVLFQSFVQYPLTLRENIAMSDLSRMEDDTAIESALRESGVYDELTPKLENGIDSYMTRRFDDVGTELSKGQWQKVALSRAYFKDSPIVIFDEPSAALDAEAEDRIFKNFEDISNGRTGIMISHRISAARMSNKIIVLNDGKIAEQGTHEELVALGGLYSRLYNLQREKYAVREAK